MTRSTPTRRPARRISLARLGGLALASTVLISGCGVLSGGVYNAPLPGGADVGSDPMTITADFADVLDLVPQSSVKIDDVAVGRVSTITLNDDGRSARVKLIVNNDVDLPAGTTARLEQTSLLGEKFIALDRPERPVAGATIGDGDTLPLADTSQAAQVEQVLGALSLVLNGGGIGQFQEISRELQKISTDRPDEIRTFLESTNTFVGSLDARSADITATLDSLARLSQTLEGQEGTIKRALDGVSPGLDVLADQRTQLVSMLESLDRLSKVTVSTLDASGDDIVADLQALAPILDRLAAAGEDLPASLEILLTYPFPDSVLDAIKGDYLNTYITTQLKTLPADCMALGCFWPQLSRTALGRVVGRLILPPADATAPVPGDASQAPLPGTDPTPGATPTPSTTPSPGGSDPEPSPSPSPSTAPSDPPPPADPGPADPPPADPPTTPGGN